MEKAGEVPTIGRTPTTDERRRTSAGGRCHCVRRFGSILHGADGHSEADRCHLFTTEHRKRRRRRRHCLSTGTTESFSGSERVQHEHLRRVLRVSSSPSSLFWGHSSLSSPTFCPWPFSASSPFPSGTFAAAFPLFLRSAVCAASFRLRSVPLLLFFVFISNLFVSSAVAQHFAVSSVPPNPNLTTDDDFLFMDTIWQIPQTLSNNFADVLPETFHKYPRSFRYIATNPWKPTDDQQMCHVWTSLAPSDLCALNSWSRLRKMREMSLFTKCPDGFSNLQLIELFRLDWRRIRSQEDLLANSDHLREGSLGRGCLLGSANSADCLHCFERLRRALEQVESVHWAFANLLHRFDCRLAKFGLASATQPFSPNTTCHNCSEWYRKWLLVNLVDLWKHPPCINWCYYTQLACPHLATNKVVEFAGHPVFLCKDHRLSEEQRSLNCSCFHPCDMVQNRLTNGAQLANSDNRKDDQSAEQRKEKSEKAAGKSERRPSPKGKRSPAESPSFDFFPASVYCERRKEICARQGNGRK